MKIMQTTIAGCFVIEPVVHADSRGYFFESYTENKFEELLGIKIDFVQDNEAYSNRGAIRGLHLQRGKFAQAKLVRVVAGRVLDVAVDLRKNSPTYGRHISVELSAENKKQLFIPRGFAHGYSVLEDGTIFSYKCDNYYHKESEFGIIYKDLQLNIDWKLKEDEIVLSDKDKLLPTLEKYHSLA